MNMFLFISAIFIGTLLLGRLLEKIRVPWIFAALLIGLVLAVYNPFTAITGSETFKFFADLGMYLLLFLVGFELDVNQLKQKSGFIFKSTFFIIFLEGVIGSLLVHYAFGTSWFVSLLVSLSFATVGEAILVPILHEFKLINSSIGQAIIGIGTADDIIEIMLLLVVSVLAESQSDGNSVVVLYGLAVLILLTVGFRLFRKRSQRFNFASIETLFLFILFVFFLFIGVGEYATAAPLAAILAGVTVRLFIHDERLMFVDNELKSLTYGFFAPLFFVSIGAELNIQYLLSAPLLIILIVLVSNGSKILGSYIMGRKELGLRGSILLGVGLSVRFSTSIIIIRFLYDHGIINFHIYTVVIASSIIFQFIVPLMFSWLVVHWGFAQPRKNQ